MKNLAEGAPRSMGGFLKKIETAEKIVLELDQISDEGSANTVYILEQRAAAVKELKQSSEYQTAFPEDQKSMAIKCEREWDIKIHYSQEHQTALKKQAACVARLQALLEPLCVGCHVNFYWYEGDAFELVRFHSLALVPGKFKNLCAELRSIYEFFAEMAAKSGEFEEAEHNVVFVETLSGKTARLTNAAQVIPIDEGLRRKDLELIELP